MQTAALRRQPNKLIASIDVTAFASIMVVLFFVVMGPFHVVRDFTGRNGTDLPKVNHAVALPGARREDAMVVSVQRDGRLWFGDSRLTPGELPAAIQNSLRQGSLREVYIEADARAKNASVNQVLNAIRSAGVDKIYFLVDQRKPQPAAP